MATLKTKRTPRFNARPRMEVPKQTMETTWVKEYIHACFEHRDVTVLPQHQRTLENLIW